MKRIYIFILIIILSITSFGFQTSITEKASEEKEINKTKDPLKKASLYIKFANKRIQLIENKRGKLTTKGNLENLNPLINEYTENLDKAYNEIMTAQALGRDTTSSYNIVNQATSKHLKVLNRVLAKAPEHTKNALRHAIEVSQRGHQKALQNLSKSKKNKNTMGNSSGPGKGKALGKQKTKNHPNKGKKKKGKKIKF